MWMKGPPCRHLGITMIISISDAFVNMKSYVPIEFSMKPRSLTEVKQWQATEFGYLLLYTGPVVLANILSEAMC
jgi:hypothetical protein